MRPILVGAILLGALLLAVACGGSKPHPEGDLAPRDDAAPVADEPRPLAKGANAPEFALADPTGRTYTLSELRSAGPVVIVFYQGSWCGTCRDQLKRFQDKGQDFSKMGARLVGISADAADKTRRLAETAGIAFPLLSDTSLAAAGGFGVTQSVGGLALAAVFVIDRDGIVRWSQVGEQVPVDQALDAAKALAPARDAGP